MAVAKKKKTVKKPEYVLVHNDYNDAELYYSRDELEDRALDMYDDENINFTVYDFKGNAFSILKNGITLVAKK